MKEIEKIIMVVMLTVLCVGVTDVHALILNDGGVHTIDYQLDDNVWVEDSPLDDFTTLNLVDGGIIRDWVEAMEYSHVNITGGSIGYDLYAENYSQVILSSGSIGDDLYVFYESQVSIYGGTIGDEVLARDFGEITIYGSGFMVDGIPVDYGTYTSSDYISGILTGILTNGDPMNNNFGIANDARITLVPEPATLLILGAGCLIFRTC